MSLSDPGYVQHGNLLVKPRAVRLNESRPENYMPSRPPKGVAGKSGTQWSGGFISDIEQQASLSGAEWAKTSVQMRRTDGRLAASWSVRKQTALSATWRFEPGDPGDPDSERYATYANEAFGLDGGAGHLGDTWENVLSQMLEFVPVGYRYLEEVYALGRDSAGDVRYFVVFEDREPSAHMHWVEGENETLAGVKQSPPGSPITEIPADKIVLLVRHLTGANWEGQGADRPAWWVWQLKRHLLDQMGIAADRWANPVPDIEVDRVAAREANYSEAEVESIRDAYILQIQNMVSRQQSETHRPKFFQVGAHGGPGTVDWAGMLATVEWCDAELSANYTTEAMRLGLTDTGARSVGEVHEQVLRRVVANDLDIIAGAICGRSRPGGGTIGRLITWNFGAVDDGKLPRLTHSGLEPDRFAESMSSLPSLVNAGLLEVDDAVKNQLRGIIGVEQAADDDILAAGGSAQGLLIGDKTLARDLARDVAQGQVPKSAAVEILVNMVGIDRLAAESIFAAIVEGSSAPPSEPRVESADPAALAARLADRIYEASRPRGQIELPL